MNRMKLVSKKNENHIKGVKTLKKGECLFKKSEKQHKQGTTNRKE